GVGAGWAPLRPACCPGGGCPGGVCCGGFCARTIAIAPAKITLMTYIAVFLILNSPQAENLHYGADVQRSVQTAVHFTCGFRLAVRRTSRCESIQITQSSMHLFSRLQMHLHELQEQLPIGRNSSVPARMHGITERVQDRLPGGRHLLYA